MLSSELCIARKGDREAPRKADCEAARKADREAARKAQRTPSPPRTADREAARTPPRKAQRTPSPPRKAPRTDAKQDPGRFVIRLQLDRTNPFCFSDLSADTTLLRDRCHCGLRLAFESCCGKGDGL